MKALHNSTLSEYRAPLGALPTGEELLLRIWAEDVSSVRLRLYQNDAESEYLMEYAGGYWQYRWTVPEKPCVLWYSFLLDAEGKTFYYGPPVGGRNQGEGLLYQEPCPSFQLTIYERSFQTPDWFRGKIMYQIFPDRFQCGDPSNRIRGEQYHQKMGRKTVLHESWEEPLLYQPLPDEKYYSPCDFYGGDLQGIIDSLDYLTSLNVGVLYLNPIVESASNHRYDTADYKQVDPFLGDNTDFSRLCQEAEKRGIRVMLDGVYSHTGSDSRYFNRQGNYKEKGAYQGPDSPYYSWYTFLSDGKGYRCWWGFDTLPEVNEHDADWQKYIITGPDSVFSHWYELGARGIRLDVADELPDEVIELMRTEWKRLQPDNVLLGEVWEDATTKRSYGVNRRYALGTGLDSVMNYPFRNFCISFLLGELDGYQTAAELLDQALNYPPPFYHSLMNLLSSHDVARIRTVLGSGKTGKGMSREEQADFLLSPEQENKGRALQRLAAVLQFTLPGVPCIYYGDEYGMQGLMDPFNREPFRRRESEMCLFYRRMSELRKGLPVLQCGGVSLMGISPDQIGILRFCLNGQDAFGRKAGDDLFLILISRGGAAGCEVELSGFCAGMQLSEVKMWREKKLCLALDIESGKRYPIIEKKLTVSIPEAGWLILKLM